jgi:L-iditol 2-dehydrogenase
MPQSKMRVASWYSNRDVRVEEMPVPQIGPGELLVAVEACGICGSDVMEWYRIDRAPLVLGHEIGGRIVEAGEGVTGFKTGDRVTVAHHVPCYNCHYCLTGHETMCETLRTTNFDPGGLAEYVRLPEINVREGVFILPDTMSYEEATFIEPIACVMRGFRKLEMPPDGTLLVIGSGIAGLLYVMVAGALGLKKIIATDINDFRLSTAKKFGAALVLKAGDDIPGAVRGLNNGLLADGVVVCTGASQVVSQALNSVERSGTVLFFAPTGPGETFPLSIYDTFWRKDVTLTTSYAGSPSDYQVALNLIRESSLPVKEMITHRLPMAEVGKGFRLVAEASESIKVVIEPRK